jgi:beta-1,4-mannosyl-glycoprotein beta-1,4-N-acetylglucosaminyltransferase
MIYDCFQFFNEFDVVEIRLEELYPIVDKFVICESTLTHSNKPNELKFMKHKDRYAKYLDKITYIVYDSFPENIGYWTLENAQRKYLLSGIDMQNLKPDDILMISDADEIPNRSFLSELLNSYNFNHPVTICQQLYYSKLTHKVIEPSMHKNWGGTVAIPGKTFKYNPDFQFYRNGKDIGARFFDTGSWHFSYMGTTEDIKNKIQSFCHSEWDQESVLNKIESNVSSCRDPLGRPEFRLEKVEIDNTYPELVKSNPEKFEHII